ncbi:hypothetical protein N8I84_41735 (plasmid) [Streptomyces cynarae]|uniref:Uncharacterized protein n=1 Tax=Streptomyces cynarae TaxID=2981134 RepID=A0ABY6EE94_9ACTN|nr:hypothetical protein [Streptomyces cynarae]UXY24957.1 hypothetical protein N8I84_41735 [Streptomyces cynarae]
MLLNLKARAMARAERRLAQFMEPGEAVLAVDICQTGSDLLQILSGRGPRVHVALSDRALYLVQRGGVTDRLPLSEISDVDFKERPDPNDLVAIAVYAADRRARLVTISLWDGRTFGFLPVGRNAVATFGPGLKARVPDRTVAEHRVELGDGRGVRVVQLRGRPGSIGFDWDFVTDDGVDVRREPLRTVFDQKMRELMRAAGDPNADVARP